MANQIANELGHQYGAEAARLTWDHLWHFWEPRMRDAIVAHLRHGGEGLTSVAAEAVRLLATGRNPTLHTRATDFGNDPEGVPAADAG